MVDTADNGKPRRRSLAGRAKDEDDPAWKAWFLEVERKRKDLAKPVRITAAYEKDGADYIISRKKSVPLPVKKWLGKLQKTDGAGPHTDLIRIREVWKEIVPADIANESGVFSFKNGVLTIAVYSNPLLQEVRQFFKEAIVKDLRERWPAQVPLVDVKFVIGNR